MTVLWIDAAWLEVYRAVIARELPPRPGCEGCRWMRADERCGHHTGLIVGFSESRYSCDTHRIPNPMYNATHGGVDCGPEARFWEPLTPRAPGV